MQTVEMETVMVTGKDYFQSSLKYKVLLLMIILWPTCTRSENVSSSNQEPKGSSTHQCVEQCILHPNCSEYYLIRSATEVGNYPYGRCGSEDRYSGCYVTGALHNYKERLTAVQCKIIIILFHVRRIHAAVWRLLAQLKQRYTEPKMELTSNTRSSSTFLLPKLPQKCMLPNGHVATLKQPHKIVFLHEAENTQRKDLLLLQ